MEREPAPGELEERRASIDALAIRRRLGRRDWGPPAEWGEGWMFQGSEERLLIVTGWPRDLDTEYDYGCDWIHASISRRPMPTYDDLKLMHRAVFDGGHAYQVFVPADEHINITENVLHLWGRADGKPALPDFGRYRRI